MDWWHDYIGRPFRDGGRGPDSYDCWGLVRAVMADRTGLALPAYGEISAADLVRVRSAMARDCDDGWVGVADPRALDVALMASGSGGRAIVHVGIMIDGARLLHVEAATAAVVVGIRHHSIAGRLRGYRRHARLVA